MKHDFDARPTKGGTAGGCHDRSLDNPEAAHHSIVNDDSEVTVEQVLELKSKIDQEIGSRKPMSDEQFKMLCQKIDNLNFMVRWGGWLNLFMFIGVIVMILITSR